MMGPGVIDVADGQDQGCCARAAGEWVPRSGAPLVQGCQLCPNSPTYWRAVREAETGEPYEPVLPLRDR